MLTREKRKKNGFTLLFIFFFISTVTQRKLSECSRTKKKDKKWICSISLLYRNWHEISFLDVHEREEEEKCISKIVTFLYRKWHSINFLNAHEGRRKTKSGFTILFILYRKWHLSFLNDHERAKEGKIDMQHYYFTSEVPIKVSECSRGIKEDKNWICSIIFFISKISWHKLFSMFTREKKKEMDG